VKDRRIEDLEKRLDHRFRDRSLLMTALTHPSYGSDHRQPDYQRLEFLGDAVIELVVSQMLFARHPHMKEGLLTRLRASMVREETISEIARGLMLGPLIRLSRCELRTGGAEKSSILCDVCEAVVAAVYLDGGFDAARELVERLMTPRLPGLDEDGLDDKSRLQEALQSDGFPSPEYQLTGQTGPDHDPLFSVCVTLEGKILGEGSGHSKRAAQQVAAREALETLRTATPERKNGPCA
jgi:ribonuclease-3